MSSAAIVAAALLSTLSVARAATVPIEPLAGTADLGVQWVQLQLRTSAPFRLPSRDRRGKVLFPP